MRVRLFPILCLIVTIGLLVPGATRADGVDDAARVAASAENVEVLGYIGGWIQTVDVQEGYAYVGEGHSLTVLDVSSPTSPTIVGKTLPMPGMVGDVIIAGGYAYAAAYNVGLQIIDISTPSHPREVGFYDTPEEAMSVTVAEGYAYIADLDGGVRVVDISDPASPREVGFYITPASAYDVTVVGNYAYVAAGDLRVVDISDPANPTEAGFYTALGYARGVAVAGNYAYVAAGDLRVVDISDPTNPTAVGFYDMPAPYRVTITERHAYVVSRGGTLQVLDISDPANPRELGFYDPPEDGASTRVGVTVAENYAYIATGYGALRVVNVSDPTNPTEAGSYVMPESVEAVAVVGAYAYVAAGSKGLWVMDVSDLANPKADGFYVTLGNADDVAIAGKYAYVAAASGDLRVLDISDSANPTEVGFCNMPGWVDFVIVSDGYAYVTSDNNSLRVVDVSDPINPVELGFFDLPGRATDVTIAGHYAYVTGRTYPDFDGWLRILDVSTPANLMEVGIYQTQGLPTAVALAEGYAYVTADYVAASLQVVDVSDPGDPVNVGIYETPGAAQGVTVGGGYLYIADLHGGLRVLDISDPANSTEAGFYVTPRSADDVAVAGGYAYVTTDNDGVFILRYTGGRPSVSPIYPTSHDSPSHVMQGGIAYRHFRLLYAGGSPIPNATITLSTGETALSDANGYFTATLSADELGGLGNHTVSVHSVTYGGQTYSTDGQPFFTIQVTERRYSHAWGYGASSRLKGGISDGLVAYLQQENSGGLELTLDEGDPNATSDDVVLMEERYSGEIGAGGGIGWKDVDIVILYIRLPSATSEFALRTLGSTEARFPTPYQPDDKKAQAIFLLASVVDSLQNAFPGKPFGVAFLSSALDLGAPYKRYIAEQQAGTGARITPLQANVGASVSLGLKRGGAVWKERILGFDLGDVGVTVLTLDTFTDYRERGEIGLGTEAEFDLDFSALSWQIGDFRNKFNGTIGDRAKKIGLEIILDADTQEFERLELSLTGEGNPYTFTDVVKEEVTVKAIIPADQLTWDVLLQTVNVLRLLQAAQQTGSKPLQIGPSAMLNELNALLAPITYVEYEVTVRDGAQTNYETTLGVSLGIYIELGPGLEVKKIRSLVRERGAFINGHPYVTESYEADSYVSRPGKGWLGLTTNALGGLWEYVKDIFSWVWRRVESGVGWIIGTVSRMVDGVTRGGARVIAPPGTKLYAAGSGSQTTAIGQTGSITVTAMGWVPTSIVGIDSLGLSPSMATALGDSFVVGGIYEFSPYTLTLSPSATLVVTYTDEAAAGVDESNVGMFRWNPDGNNWQSMATISDTLHNAFTATITQLGTFTLGCDDTPPEISILAPPDGSTIGNSLPLISALVVDTGAGVDPSTVGMRLGGQVVMANYITGTGQLLYLPGDPLANGTHTVTVSATDVMGHQGSASAAFTVEVTRCLYLPVILRKH
jgi:hypothetical protein